MNLRASTQSEREGRAHETGRQHPSHERLHRANQIPRVYLIPVALHLWHARTQRRYVAVYPTNASQYDLSRHPLLLLPTEQVNDKTLLILRYRTGSTTRIAPSSTGSRTRNGTRAIRKPQADTQRSEPPLGIPDTETVGRTAGQQQPSLNREDKTNILLRPPDR